MFIDSHCHLDRLKLDPYNGHLSKAIEAATENLVDLMLCVAIDLEHIEDVLSIAATHDSVYASVGVHPGSTDCEEPTVDGLIALSKRDKVIAIGETGLDYYYGVEHKELQLEWFKRHLEVSKRTRKPVIIHTRDAKEDTLRYIHDYSDPDVAGVLHCFTEDLDMAKRAIDHNFYISFSGIVTFKNALELKEVAKALPLDRILIETDSPYLAPVPMRGKSNEPKFVPHVARYLAELKGVSVEELAEQTSLNFKKLFLNNA
ncbi:MAG: TatD family hydrolase [Oleiphilus sp.]